MRNPDDILYPPQPLTVDCSANPYDLRPAIAGIVERVEQVSNHLRSIGSGQKIVVIMGECHTMPSHILLQAGVLKALREKHRITFGYEDEHNSLTKILAKARDFNLSPAEEIALRELDSHGKKSLMMNLATTIISDAPLTGKTLFSFLVNSNIPYAPTDAATRNFSFDTADPLTKSFLEKRPWYKKIFTKITPTISSEGVSVRNRVMAHLTEAFMATHDVSIGIQQCGKFHVVGTKLPIYKKLSLEYKFDDSLHAVFSRAGLFPIPVFLDDGFFNASHLPPEGRGAFNQGVHVTGLAEDTFIKSSPSGSEGVFIQKIASQSGLEIKLFSDQDRDDLEQLIKIEAPFWVMEARQAVARKERGLCTQTHPSSHPA